MDRLDYNPPVFDGLWGAFHGGELGFFFNNVDSGLSRMFGGLYAERNDRYEVQQTLHESFVNFAFTGDPSADRIGQWDAFNTDSRPTMLLDSECVLEDDPEA